MDSKANNFFYSVESVLEDVKEGNIIIIVDDKSADNEGVYFQAAEKVTSSSMNFFITHCRGLLYLACKQSRIDELEIPLIDRLLASKSISKTFRFYDNSGKMCGSSIAMSIDSAEIKSTGASAVDRVATIKAFINKNTSSKDFLMPGHIFPIIYHEGGVLARAGHLEAGIDIVNISGMYPAGIVCEIINDNGEIAKLADLIKISEKFNIKILTIEELIRYRKRKEKLIEKIAEIRLPTKWGEFKALTYRSTINPETHIAFVKGEIKGKKDIIVRVHSQCLTGDTFGSERCDCGQQLETAFDLIRKKGRGVLLYMAQEGRGIGLCNKMKAYELQDKGLDTVEANIKLGFEADMRDYGIGAQILSDLGLTTIHLLTNNPKKIIGLEGYGIKITKILPIIIRPNSNNLNYLNTKKAKLDHMLDYEDSSKK